MNVISNLHPQFRFGQVFLTWSELPENQRDLSVFIAPFPITAQNIDRAHLLTDRLEPHSAHDWYDDPLHCPKTPGIANHGWIIENNRSPLDSSDGLFVHTVTASDPDQAFFAVLARGFAPEELLVGKNSTSNPVAIYQAPIRPIYQLADPLSDTRDKPVALHLHSHQGRPDGQLTHLVFGDSTWGWREGLPFKFKVSISAGAVLVEPFDRVWINRKMTTEEASANGDYDTLYKNIETWWYGTSDNIHDSELVASGTPTNYTERRTLWFLDYVQQHYHTDPNRVYAFGASMGSGVLRLAARNPGKFACIDLLVPLFDLFSEGRLGDRFLPRVGEPNLLCSDSMQLRDRVNMVDYIGSVAQDLPPIIFRAGRNDVSATWERKPDLIRAAQIQRHALLVGWDDGTHATAMRNPVEEFPNWLEFRYHSSRYALNRSFPAFSHSSLDESPGHGSALDGDSIGFINRGLNWQNRIDSPATYELLITVTHPEAVYPVTVDVTPRRRQAFCPAPGEAISAQNIAFDGGIVDSRTLTVDDAGRITYSRFTITSRRGNIFVLRK